MQKDISMSVIKLEIRLGEIPKALAAFRESRKKALEGLTNELRTAVSNTVEELLAAEIDLFLGEPGQEDNKRNGYYPSRDYFLKGVGGIRVRSPRDRKGRFDSAIIPRSERMDPRLRADMAVLHLAGLSTRIIQIISRRLLGVEVSKDTISSSLNLVHAEALAWLERPIDRPFWALYVDGV